MPDTKVLIKASFHRFVPVPGQAERKEIYSAGQTVAVPEADATDWIAKGLAVSAGHHPLDHDGNGRKGGSRPALT